MKTLYEILEVSETASNEVIEKAYRVLAKKYHPDLQPESKKQESEEKMKKINDAYSVLSDANQRETYNQELKRKRDQQEQERIQEVQRKARQQNQTQKSQNNNEQSFEQEPIQEEVQQTVYMDPNVEKKIRKKAEREIKEQYQEAYDDYYRRLGYKVPIRWTWKKVKELGIVILVLIAFCLALWIFPPTHVLLVDLYTNNIFIQTLVNVIVSIFKALGDTFIGIFKHS